MTSVPTKANTAFTKVHERLSSTMTLPRTRKWCGSCWMRTATTRRRKSGSAARLAEKLHTRSRLTENNSRADHHGLHYHREEAPSSLVPQEGAESTGVRKERRLSRDEKLREDLKRSGTPQAGERSLYAGIYSRASQMDTLKMFTPNNQGI